MIKDVTKFEGNGGGEENVVPSLVHAHSQRLINLNNCDFNTDQNICDYDFAIILQP